MYELAAGGGAIPALVVALITVGLGGIIGLWLRSLISPQGGAESAHELARVWAGWVIFASCITMLPGFIGKLDRLSFFKWFVGGGILVAIAYLLGWAYGNLFRFRDGDVRSPSARMPINTPRAEPVTDPRLYVPNAQLALFPPAYAAVSGLDFEEQAIAALTGGDDNPDAAALLENALNELEEKAYDQVGQELETHTVDRATWTKAFAQAGGDDQQTRVVYIQLRVDKLVSSGMVRLKAEQELAEKRARDEARARAADELQRSRALPGKISRGLIDAKTASAAVGELGTQFLNLCREADLKTLKEMVERQPMLLAVADIEGNTALHIVSVSRGHEFIQYFLQAGANRNARNLFGDTPLDAAASLLGMGSDAVAILGSDGLSPSGHPASQNG